MRKLRLLLLALLFLSFSPSSFAGNDAGQPGEFLNIGVGARPLGMGHAFTGVSDDVDAIYWNPGGLGTFRSSQVTFQQAPLIEGGAHQYIGLAQPIYTYGNLGVGVINLVSDDVPRTDENFIETGSFKNRETAYMFAYGHRFGDHLGLGGTAKYVEHSIDEEKAGGFGGDAGVLYSFNEKYRLGAMVRNLVQPKYKFDTDTETFPRVGRLGVSGHFFQNRLLAAFDLEQSFSTEQAMKWHTGVEGSITNNIVIRAGIDQLEYTGGIGFGWKSFFLDYALGYQDLGLYHRVSFKIFFGGFEVDAKASPSVFSPSGLKTKTDITLMCRNRQRVIRWILSVKDSQNNVVRSFNGFNQPPESVEWDGKNSQGHVVKAGIYYYQFTVVDKNNNLEKSPVRSLKITAQAPIEIEAQ